MQREQKTSSPSPLPPPPPLFLDFYAIVSRRISYRGGWDFIGALPSPPVRWNDSWADKGVNYCIDKKSISRAPLVIQFFFYFFFCPPSFLLLLLLFDKLRKIIETIFRIFFPFFFPLCLSFLSISCLSLSLCPSRQMSEIELKVVR